MFKKILVPLDGSAEAETVLPYVRDLASRFDSEVNFLSIGLGSKRRRVNQLLDDYMHHVVEHLQRHDITCRATIVYSSAEEEALEYAEVSMPGQVIKSKGTVLYGGPADEILGYSKKHHMDLVIMATHGHGGLRRWWLGSVSEKVVSQSTIPVLLIHSKQVKEIDKEKKSTFNLILAPLDGSEIGEAALHDAETVALKTGAAMMLLHIIPEPHSIEARIMGPEFKKFLNALHDSGEKYLEKICARLAAKGIDVDAKIITGEPAESIIELAGHEKADLIAMSTHGRSGVARWVLGSVADKVLHASKLPMWLSRSQRILHELENETRAGQSLHR